MYHLNKPLLLSDSHLFISVPPLVHQAVTTPNSPLPLRRRRKNSPKGEKKAIQTLGLQLASPKHPWKGHRISLSYHPSLSLLPSVPQGQHSPVPSCPGPFCYYAFWLCSETAQGQPSWQHQQRRPPHLYFCGHRSHHSFSYFSHPAWLFCFSKGGGWGSLGKGLHSNPCTVMSPKTRRKHMAFGF